MLSHMYIHTYTRVLCERCVLHATIRAHKGRLGEQVARDAARNRVQGPRFSGIECTSRVLFMCITSQLDAQSLTAKPAFCIQEMGDNRDSKSFFTQVRGKIEKFQNLSAITSWCRI